MKLVTFKDTAGARIGVLTIAGIIDIAAADPGLPRTMRELIETGPAALENLKAAVAGKPAVVSRDKAELLAPVPEPRRNIFCVGKNYREHAAEFHNSGFDANAKDAIPKVPIIFTKAATTVIGPSQPIPGYLDHSASTDYEGELVVILGKGGRGIRAADAFKHVFGYTIVNDVTARTLQNLHSQWFVGKNIDGFCPMGPCVVTADEIPDVSALQLQTRVNGELRQDASVSQLIFDIPTLIETLSRTMTLLPGDMIATGTCAGVGIGFKPPKFLAKGDVVAITIEPIGTLTNEVA